MTGCTQLELAEDHTAPVSSGIYAPGLVTCSGTTMEVAVWLHTRNAAERVNGKGGARQHNIERVHRGLHSVPAVTSWASASSRGATDRYAVRKPLWTQTCGALDTPLGTGQHEPLSVDAPGDSAALTRAACKRTHLGL
jgi:hypothetical protein